MPDYTQYTPQWWQPDLRLPSVAPSAQTQFLEMINKLLPYTSPNDYRRWATYLYANAPNSFGAYAPENLAGWQPTITPQQQAQFETPERHTQARQAISQAVDVDSPVKAWLDAITKTAEEYAPGGTFAPEGRRTRAQQRGYEQAMTTYLEQPTGYGVSQEEAALWRPWLETYIAPTTGKMAPTVSANAPEWMLRSSLYGPQSNKVRGSRWANPGWF